MLTQGTCEYRIAATAGVCFSVTARSEEEAIKVVEEIIEEHIDGLDVPTWDEDGRDVLDMRVYLKTQQEGGSITIEDCSPLEDEDE